MVHFYRGVLSAIQDAIRVSGYFVPVIAMKYHGRAPARVDRALPLALHCVAFEYLTVPLSPQQLCRLHHSGKRENHDFNTYSGAARRGEYPRTLYGSGPSMLMMPSLCNRGLRNLQSTDNLKALWAGEPQCCSLCDFPLWDLTDLQSLLSIKVIAMHL